MTSKDTQVMDIARTWLLRTSEPGFDGWDAFTGWLEADPAHLDAYEQALDDDAWAADAVAAAIRDDPGTLATAGSERPEGSPGSATIVRRPAIWGGAIAACLAVAAAWTLSAPGSQLTEIATGSGEHRSIALGDGSRVEVNGNSLVTYNPDDPRHITLAHGEALFEVTHDEANPFVVTVGQTRLIDAGTIFNVASEAGTLDVAVSEGLVIYADGRDEIELAPGDRLRRAAPGAPVEVVRTELANVGSWRDQLRIYDNTALHEIARDLSRVTGKPVRIGAGAQRMRYSGTLLLEGTERELLASAGALLGVRMVEREDHWEMTPGDASSR